MRIRLAHDTVYAYETPARGVIQTLRLTPRNHDGQYVVRWRIEVSEDTHLAAHEDAFGNITHIFTADGPFDKLTVRVEGEVETQDTSGIVRGSIERFPPALYLRETALTAIDPSISDFAQETRAAAGADVLTLMHALMSRLHAVMTFDTKHTLPTTTAGEAFALKRGVCQDFTQVFIAGARSLGVPARYVSGHFCRTGGIIEQEAGHAWAEAHVPGLGWVGFDAANKICTTESHVRVAVGLDYLGAAPVRGTRNGGSGETLAVRVQIDPSMNQAQN